MGLKRRLIGKILIDQGVAIKFKQFTRDRRIVGNPVSVAKVLEDQKIDEIMLVDLGVISPALVRDVTDALNTPVTAAGGIHTMEQVDELIRECGVEKVVVKHPALVEKIADRFGSQAVTWAVDYHGDFDTAEVPHGVGEVLFTSIDRDGTGRGFDLNPTLALRRWPVVLCGGCGRLDHVKQAFDAGADGVAISSMFAFTDKSPVKVRSHLAGNGVAVRPLG